MTTGAQDSPRLSVVIPTYERRASVARALRALATQTVDATTYEVIVVIDGSTDGTRDVVSMIETPYALRMISKARGGRASACNAGWRQAAAPIVLFLDDDMEAAPALLASHLDAHGGGARIGVVGAVPIVTTASSTPVARYVASRFNGHLRNLGAPGYEFGLRDFYSGNFSIARKAMSRVGGFDESFTAYGNEDLELSLRLRADGVRLVFRGDAVAHQHYEKSFMALARDNEEKGRTAVQLASKHPGASSDLKISQFDRGPVVPRLARNLLLESTRHWSGTRDVVVRTVSRLSDWDVPGLRHVYPVALDYLYWLGVRSARDVTESGADAAPAPALSR